MSVCEGVLITWPPDEGGLEPPRVYINSLLTEGRAHEFSPE